jgi:hypothetical protein
MKILNCVVASTSETECALNFVTNVMCALISLQFQIMYLLTMDNDRKLHK